MSEPIVLKLDTSSIVRESKKADKALDKLARSADRGQSKLAKVGGAMTKLAAAAGITVGIVALSVALKGAAKAAEDFETALAEVSTLLTSGVAEQMEEIQKAAEDLSRTYGLSAISEAKAFYSAISAGAASAAEATSVLTTANKLAVGGITDAETAIDGLTTILNAYGLEAEASLGISDSLFTAMRLGKTTISELAMNIGTVAPMASLAGVALDEVLASIVALTKQGVDTNQAVTQINQVIATFVKPTGKATRAAKEFGVELNATALKSRGLVGSMNEIARVTNGSAEAMAKLFPNIRAFKGAAVLAGGGADDFNDALAALTDSAGQTDIAVEKMMATSQFTKDVFVNEVAVGARAVGQALLSATVPAMQAATTTMQFLRDHSKELGIMFDVVKVAAAALSIFLLTKGVAALTVYVGAVTAAELALFGLAGAIGLVEAAMAPLVVIGGAIAGVLSVPLVAIGVAVGGVTVALKSYQARIEEVDPAQKLAAESAALVARGIDGVGFAAREGEVQVKQFFSIMTTLSDVERKLLGLQPKLTSAQLAYANAINKAEGEAEGAAKKIKDLERQIGALSLTTGRSTGNMVKLARELEQQQDLLRTATPIVENLRAKYLELDKAQDKSLKTLKKEAKAYEILVKGMDVLQKEIAEENRLRKEAEKIRADQLKAINDLAAAQATELENSQRVLDLWHQGVGTLEELEGAFEGLETSGVHATDTMIETYIEANRKSEEAKKKVDELRATLEALARGDYSFFLSLGGGGGIDNDIVTGTGTGFGALAGFLLEVTANLEHYQKTFGDLDTDMGEGFDGWETLAADFFFVIATGFLGASDAAARFFSAIIQSLIESFTDSFADSSGDAFGPIVGLFVGVIFSLIEGIAQNKDDWVSLSLEMQGVAVATGEAGKDFEGSIIEMAIAAQEVANELFNLVGGISTAGVRVIDFFGDLFAFVEGFGFLAKGGGFTENPFDAQMFKDAAAALEAALVASLGTIDLSTVGDRMAEMITFIMNTFETSGALSIEMVEDLLDLARLLDGEATTLDTALREVNTQFDNMASLAIMAGIAVEEVEILRQAALEQTRRAIEQESMQVEASLLERLALYTDNDQVLAKLDELRLKMEVNNFFIQIELLRQLGVIAESEIDFLLGLAQQVQAQIDSGALTQVPGGRRGGGGRRQRPTPTGPTPQDILEDMIRGMEDLAGITISAFESITEESRLALEHVASMNLSEEERAIVVSRILELQELALEQAALSALERAAALLGNEELAAIAAQQRFDIEMALLQAELEQALLLENLSDSARENIQLALDALINFDPDDEGKTTVATDAWRDFMDQFATEGERLGEKWATFWELSRAAMEEGLLTQEELKAGWIRMQQETILTALSLVDAAFAFAGLQGSSEEAARQRFEIEKALMLAQLMAMKAQLVGLQLSTQIGTADANRISANQKAVGDNTTRAVNNIANEMGLQVGFGAGTVIDTFGGDPWGPIIALIDSAIAAVMGTEFVWDPEGILPGIIGAIEGQTDRLEDALQGLRDLMQNLLISDLSPLTPEQQMAAATARYEDLIRRAATGDIDAINELQSFVPEFLRLAEAFYGGTATTGYGELFSQIFADLSSITGDPNPLLNFQGGGGGGDGLVDIVKDHHIIEIDQRSQIASQAASQRAQHIAEVVLLRTVMGEVRDGIEELANGTTGT